MTLCPCGSSLPLSECCQPIIDGQRPATSALELMRARYTAYTLGAIDFIMHSTHPDHRDLGDRQAMENWSVNAQWLGLEILDPGHPDQQDLRQDEVEFKVRFQTSNIQHLHHERSTFSHEQGTWWFVDGHDLFSGPLEKPRPVVKPPTCGRNDPCPCGSGKKFKKCCLPNR